MHAFKYWRGYRPVTTIELQEDQAGEPRVVYNGGAVYGTYPQERPWLPHHWAPDIPDSPERERDPQGTLVLWNHPEQDSEPLLPGD